MKINKSIFIKNLIIEKRVIDCNANIIPIKANLLIEMGDLGNYKKTDFEMY